MKPHHSKPKKGQTDEEREKLGPRLDFAGVHRARELRTMLINSATLATLPVGPAREAAADEMLKVFQHWLMDLSHEVKMTKPRNLELELLIGLVQERLEVRR